MYLFNVYSRKEMNEEEKEKEGGEEEEENHGINNQDCEKVSEDGNLKPNYGPTLL